jgi:hypothetical protein
VYVFLRNLATVFLLLSFFAPAVFAGDVRTPEKVFSKMESNLANIKNRRLKFRAEATGSVNGTFEGEIVFKKGNVMDYRTAGKLAGRDHKLFISCDGKKLRGGADDSGAKIFDIGAPAGLRSGMLIGLSRMGLMHNISRLAENEPPDRIDGSVYTWLSANDLKFNKDHKDGSPLASAELKQNGQDLMVVFYKLGVGETKNAADVELWIDTKTNLPTYRRMTVHFPNGDMQLSEKYEWSKV